MKKQHLLLGLVTLLLTTMMGTVMVSAETVFGIDITSPDLPPWSGTILDVADDADKDGMDRAAELPIDSSTFPDPNLQEYIRAEVDTDGNGTLSQAELDAVTTLTARSTSTVIIDLRGIQYFQNLAQFIVVGPNIHYFDVTEFAHLTHLAIAMTNLESVDLSQNAELKAFICHATPLTELDLRNNAKLELLNCSDINIEHLDLSQNPLLNSLSCVQIPLWSITLPADHAYTLLEIPDPSLHTIEVDDIYFDITDEVPDIDISKISDVTGASYDASTGRFTDYAVGTSTINFSYDCGMANGSPVKLNIALEVTTWEVPIDEDHFPDPILRDYVATHFDTDGNGALSFTERDTATEIDLDDQTDFADLDGVDYLDGLINLYCDNTSIANSDFDFSYNTLLERFYCRNTKITSLNMTENPALKRLYFSGTDVATIDLTKNPALERVHCENTKLTTLDVSKNPALKRLYCYSTDLSSIDVTKNPLLERLFCNGTQISSIDVSHNPNLIDLMCFDTDISSIDVTKNPALQLLGLEYTNISSIDVSKNPELTALSVHHTQISTLDLSNNPKINQLYCGANNINGFDASHLKLMFLECMDAPLAWMNLGTQGAIEDVDQTLQSTSTLSYATTEKTFNMVDAFPGIDISKISNVSGATYDASTGIMSNYKKESPTITYSYDCGTIDGTAHTLAVTMNLTGVKSESIIRVTDSLGKVYDGKAVKAEPAVEKSGSTGAVTYIWEKQNTNKSWSAIDGAPKEIGIYRVTAVLAADENYYDATSAPLEFEITKAKTTTTPKPSYTKPTAGTTTKGTTAKTTKSPATADSSTPALWIAMIFLAMGTIGVVCFKKYRYIGK